jgi:hypothetical protein
MPASALHAVSVDCSPLTSRNVLGTALLAAYSLLLLLPLLPLPLLLPLLLFSVPLLLPVRYLRKPLLLLPVLLAPLLLPLLLSLLLTLLLKSASDISMLVSVSQSGIIACSDAATLCQCAAASCDSAERATVSG